MRDTALCFNCQNKNEVKVSSGHSKPENKGRKYFTCINCDKFNWVEDGVGVHTSGLKVDYSKNQDAKPPISYQPKEETDEEEIVENEWAPVARENMAKKALDIAANFYARVQIDDEDKIIDRAEVFYDWLKSKRENQKYLKTELVSNTLNR